MIETPGSSAKMSEDYFPPTFSQCCQNLIEDLCFFGGRTITVYFPHHCGGKQEGYEVETPFSWSRVALRAGIIFVAILPLIVNVGRFLPVCLLAAALCVTIPIVKMRFCAIRTPFVLIDSVKESEATALLKAALAKNQNDQELSKDEIDKIFEYYDSSKLSHRQKKWIVEQMTFQSGLIGCSPTDAQYNLLLEKIRERQLEDKCRHAKQNYQQIKATEALYQAHPELEKEGAQIQDVDVSLICAKLQEKGFPFPGEYTQMITKELIEQLNRKTQKNDSLQISKREARRVVIYGAGSSFYQIESLFPFYYSGISVSDMRYLSSDRYFSDYQTIMKQSVLATILDGLIEQEKIAYYEFTTGTSCVIQA